MNGTEIEKNVTIDTVLIRSEALDILKDLLNAAKLEAGSLIVVGCSSSEVTDHTIGTCSSEIVGQTIFDALYCELLKHDIYIAAQCCEHLNRALIVEREYARMHQLEEVNVRPQLKAGGSFATAAFHSLIHPCAVEFIKADAGIDIGDTLIGMHLKPVAVPVRTSRNTIGNAHVVCARTRAKYIGGERAAYL